MKQGLMDFLTLNYMDKHDSNKGTADALIKARIPSSKKLNFSLKQFKAEF